MKLKSKLKLYEEFVNESKESIDSVSVDQVTVGTTNASDAIRTEVIRDVDTILDTLAELSDRIGESASIDLEIDELYEELFDLTNVSELNEGILDFIKSPIKFMKIKKNLKAYQKALVQKAINDVDFAKKKQVGDADEKDKKRMETLKQANQAKNKALDDQLSAISERMTELSNGDEGLGKVVSIGKTKSKLAAAQIVMKATSGEEAKQLKLEIDTLSDRIAADEKSLKDYARKQEPAEEPAGTSTDDNSGDEDNETSKNQLAGIGGEETKEEKAEREAKEKEAKEKEAKEKAEKEKAEKEKAEKETGQAGAPAGEPTGGQAGEPTGGQAGEPVDDDKIAKNIEKLEAAETKAKEAYDALPEDADMKTKAAAKIKHLQTKLALAEAQGDDENSTYDKEAVAKIKSEIEVETAKMNAKPIAAPVGPTKDETEPAAQENLNTEGNVLVEASVSGMMAYDEEESGYKYLKQQAKKLGVKVSVDVDPYGDGGYDELSFSGSKAAIMKLAAISGHDQDINDGVYELTESKEVELPKTIKLDEGLSIAEKFARLMNK